MTIRCPKCGKEVPDESKYCLSCGCSISGNGSSSFKPDIFSNGKIFLAMILIVLIVGGIIIFTMSGNNNAPTADDALSKEASEFSLTISDINGYYSSENDDYFFWVDVLFQKVPSNTKDYIVKTTYLDENNNDVAHEIESLANAYYETDYPISVGYHTSYKYIDIDSVKVEIIRDGTVIKECSAKIDKNTLNFDKPQGNETK